MKELKNNDWVSGLLGRKRSRESLQLAAICLSSALGRNGQGLLWRKHYQRQQEISSFPVSEVRLINQSRTQLL